MTEMQLGEELINQIETVKGLPNKPFTVKQTKFDSHGNLHLLYRDEDGKLLHDNSIKKTIEMPGLSREMELHEDLVQLRKKTKSGDIIFKIIVGCILASTLYVLFDLMFR